VAPPRYIIIPLIKCTIYGYTIEYINKGYTEYLTARNTTEWHRLVLCDTWNCNDDNDTVSPTGTYGFSRKMAQTTRTRARMCLFGDSSMARRKARGRLAANWTFLPPLTVDTLWANIGWNCCVWKGGHFERKFEGEGGRPPTIVF